MAERPYIKVNITPKGERALRNGHPWVFADEITAISGGYENGDIVDVYSSKERYLGSGFINDNSKIRVRIVSRNANDRFDEAFWERRVRYAIEYRRTVMGNDFDNCRLIFGEADQFPGLTVDRFGDTLVTQTLSMGIERLKDVIFPSMVKVLREMSEDIRCIYERNDVAIRSKEGLSQGKGFYSWGDLETELGGHTEICENGIRYDVDYINGQKTGFFLDQKYNRLAAAKIAAGKKVLDCFTHTGSFGLNAAMGGAEKVVSVDISADAIALARENARRNGLEDKIDYVCADVFDLLTDMANKGEKGRYDMIILDPPAFTKSSATVKNAVRGYKEINLKAMKLLPRGGYLATCSCSHFMTDELFRKMLQDAAADADVSLRQIEARQQGPDHPILWNVPETDYLKFYIFQVV
ncbi:MAG: class I SAM-dependent rRNA methyltransferase [Ruminococcaceae bacterium]|nr:class I SAM-dependent rRNA methyltransferase [Oscillospiraceae bacterium]